MTGIQKRRVWYCAKCKKSYDRPLGYRAAAFCTIHPSEQFEVILQDMPITKEEFARLLEREKKFPKWFQYEGHRAAYAFRQEFGTIFNEMRQTYIETGKIPEPANPNPLDQTIRRVGRPAHLVPLIKRT